jgi:hypothetical protein
MKYLLLVILLFTVYGCAAPEFMSYKDNNYYVNRKSNKTLYMFPVSSITLGESDVGYTDPQAKQSVSKNRDSLMMLFNQAYYSLSKSVKKCKISLINTPDPYSFKIRDTNAFFREEVFDRKYKKRIEVAIPRKCLLDSLGIKCNYLFYISDLHILYPTYLHSTGIPIFIPFVIPINTAMIFGVIGFNLTSPGLTSSGYILLGKYVLWDSDSGRVVCAGGFGSALTTTDIYNEKVKKDYYTIIAQILNKTPYWSVF